MGSSSAKHLITTNQIVEANSFFESSLHKINRKIVIPRESVLNTISKMVFVRGCYLHRFCICQADEITPFLHRI